MVSNILNYIKGCPYLSDFNYNVEYLGKKSRSLSVSGRQKTETVKTYTDGDKLVKDMFLLKLRLPYGVDTEKNLDNCKLIENISQWFTENSVKGILPEVHDSVAVSAEIDFSKHNAVYLADTVVYTAEITVLYYKTKSL